MTLKIWFFWTPELSKQVVSDIFDHKNFSIEFVVTNPDKKIGRKQEISSSPVKIFAQKNNIPIFQPEKIRNNKNFFAEISAYNCDYFVVVAYGKILPKEILEMPKKMCINVHGSLLPKYRGASPIQSALLAWESETGVTIMQMSEWMDEWDMLLQEKILISPDETSKTLFQKFGEISGKTLISAIEKLEKQEISPQKQNEKEATYCTKIDKEHGKIDWNIWAKKIFHAYQAYTPWPGIFAYYKGKRILFEKISYLQNSQHSGNPKIQKISGKYGICFEDGIIFPEIIKPEWKKSQNFSDFINGNREILETGFDS